MKQAIDFAGSVHAVGYADKGRIRLAELKITSGARDVADDLLSSMKTRLSEVAKLPNRWIAGHITHLFWTVSSGRWRGLPPGLRTIEGTFKQYRRGTDAIQGGSVSFGQPGANICRCAPAPHAQLFA